MPIKRDEDPNYSLHKIFSSLVWRHFFSDVRLEEPEIATYVSGLLTEYVRTDNLYGIKNAAGEHIDDIGQMLLESNPLLGAASFDREREVRKHVGDYALFMTGLFPESMARSRRAKQVSLGGFLDLVKVGKESYAIVSSFDQFEYRDEAPLFRMLSENFEMCIFGLNLVKHDLEELQRSGRQPLDSLLPGSTIH
jgi:hypothetical protein